MMKAVAEVSAAAGTEARVSLEERMGCGIGACVTCACTVGGQRKRVCKDGAVYNVHQGVCFETQFFPNSLNLSHFPSTILKAGEKFDSTTEYKFSK